MKQINPQIDLLGMPPFERPKISEVICSFGRDESTYLLSLDISKLFGSKILKTKYGNETPAIFNRRKDL
jgi:hypothetical protein